MNRNTIPHHSRFSSLLEYPIPDFTSSNLHRIFPPLDRDLEYLLNSRFAMYSRFGDFRQKIRDGLSDRFD